MLKRLGLLGVLAAIITALALSGRAPETARADSVCYKTSFTYTGVGTGQITFPTCTISGTNGYLNVNAIVASPIPVTIVTPLSVFFASPQPIQPITFASAQPVTGTFWQTTQPVSIASAIPVQPITFASAQPISGTVTANQGTAAAAASAWPIKLVGADGATVATVSNITGLGYHGVHVNGANVFGDPATFYFDQPDSGSQGALMTSAGGAQYYRLTASSATTCTSLTTGNFPHRLFRIANSGAAQTVFLTLYDESSATCTAGDELQGDGTVTLGAQQTIELQWPVAHGIVYKLSGAITGNILISTS